MANERQQNFWPNLDERAPLFFSGLSTALKGLLLKKVIYSRYSFDHLKNCHLKYVLHNLDLSITFAQIIQVAMLRRKGP